MIKTVFSDAGDILFSSRGNWQDLKIALQAYSRDLGILDIENEYVVYRNLAQTVMDPDQALKKFFSDIGKPQSYYGFKRPMQTLPTLFPGSVGTLEYLRKKSIPLWILSDSVLNRKEMKRNVEEMIVGQLKERGPVPNFSLDQYISGFVSSRDLGIKKPAKEFFSYALKKSRHNGSIEEAVYVAHESKEIFGALDLGFIVIACNYMKEKDYEHIQERILMGSDRLYSMDSFAELPRILEKVI
jgi:FMN phosphatase YigB (HAD superfamily)